MSLRVFPVAAEGAPHYADDFAYVAPGKVKPHGGIDIFAAEGTPVFAVDDGGLEHVPNALGGNAFKLTAAGSRTFYYGAHLSRYEGEPRSVLAGEVIGYVGMTGNAAHTSPHLHFEVHLGGGVAGNPFLQLSALSPQPSNDVHPLPPAPASPADDLPALAVVLGPVAPVGAVVDNMRRRGPGPVVALFGLGLGLALVRARR